MVATFIDQSLTITTSLSWMNIVKKSMMQLFLFLLYHLNICNCILSIGLEQETNGETDHQLYLYFKKNSWHAQLQFEMTSFDDIIKYYSAT